MVTETQGAETQVTDLVVYPVEVHSVLFQERARLQHEVQMRQGIHTIQHAAQQHVLSGIVMAQEQQHALQEQQRNQLDLFVQILELQDRQQQEVQEQQLAQLTPDQQRGQVGL